MLNLNTHPVIRAMVCLALLTGNTTVAQERWFRVELLVFSHKSPQTTERWDPTPELKYPTRSRFLQDPSSLGSGGNTGNASPNSPTISGATDPNSPAVAAEEENILLPTPFVALPDSQQEFRGKAAYMQRSGRYRVLFHETWVQPVAGQSTALPIVLDRSGDTGLWPQLQGSVKFYLSRYLHLETNLWLNTAGEYLPGEWTMPPPPLGPLSSPPVESEPVVAVYTPTRDGDPATDTATPQEQALMADPGPQYPFRHAVPLRQKRRMRSTEVHYIDHPLLGVVTKLTPITAEELESLAREESGLAF